MSKPKKFLSNLKARFDAFEESRTGKRVLRLLSLFFTASIIAYLVYKLTLIGWDNVWESLPQTPWFYILLLVMFFTLPVFQVFIYRVAWKVRPWHLFLGLLNKRVLDKDVLGYSGEMYLYVWARKYVDKPDKEILHVLKDNVILSSAASTLVAVVLLVIFFVFGQVSIPEEWMNPNVTLLVVLGFCVVLVIGLAVKFRKRILFLKRKQILAIFGLHICRLLVVQGLQVIQWMVVMPEIPLTNWLTLLAAQIIITRIPLLPSRDLIFMGTGIEMSQFINVTTSSMAGMLLAASVLNKILNLIFFILVFFTLRKRKPENI
ncbi:MAG: hypothetical protein GTO45_32735 [Candidatus Aminicenantes bacterium]|nr:hypothetical protein [Candidatus Aminicenantes bacterium]NIM83518.1 hypothetical protein [Candidatus Aminicenantes bacterium]NIN22907.1 hypothetical protein [Candidatus Aminicenantes bacterium]NIN46646.1 hypothetical protein [Candidatus Aminicenantes bacterium]NIN89549.1 hypothetical protein [Candidatus Aminicenantes bacterium]